MQQPPVVEYVAPQAREQGKQQGALETTRKLILELLSQRLGTNVEQRFKSELDTIDDLQLLEALFTKAMQVDSIEEFKQTLEKSDILS